jgi:hypothetical protein
VELPEGGSCSLPPSSCRRGTTTHSRGRGFGSSSFPGRLLPATFLVNGMRARLCGRCRLSSSPLRGVSLDSKVDWTVIAWAIPCACADSLRVRLVQL